MTKKPKRIPTLLLSAQNAAVAMGCTFDEMRKLLWTGQVPTVRIGNRRLVRSADLRAYIRREKDAR